MTGANPTPPYRTSPPDLIVRQLRWSDFEPLRDLYYLLYEERKVQRDIGLTLFRTPPSNFEEVSWFTGLYRAVQSGDAVAAVAERNGHVVGSCVVRRVGLSESSEAGHVGLLGILVHRDHRGAGAGRALLAHALAQCRAKFEIVRLSVFSVNVRARKLYEEFGFRYIGTVPRHVLRDGEYFDEDLMVLDLGPTDENR
ncbi:MAG: GNAT family N-acetyltransferase [Thermoplasmata archaeon]